MIKIQNPKSLKHLNFKYSNLFRISNLGFRICSNRAGFTLIELLVAMGLFAVLSGIVAGSFISIMKSQRTVISLISANDNASLAFEQISREIRTGSKFILNGESELAFTNARGKAVSYKFEDETIKRQEDGSEFSSILASDIKVKSFKFYLLGEEPGDSIPTLVTMALSLVSGRGSLENLEINLQTSVVSRLLDS